MENLEYAMPNKKIQL